VARNRGVSWFGIISVNLWKRKCVADTICQTEVTHEVCVALKRLTYLGNIIIQV
jgi:hypothetical protein